MRKGSRYNKRRIALHVKHLKLLQVNCIWCCRRRTGIELWVGESDGRWNLWGNELFLWITLEFWGDIEARHSAAVNFNVQHISSMPWSVERQWAWCDDMMILETVETVRKRRAFYERIFIPLHYLSHKFNVYCLEAIKIISFHMESWKWE